MNTDRVTEQTPQTRTWEECELPLLFSRKINFCKITTSTNKIVYGQFVHQDGHRVWDLYIPLRFEEDETQYQESNRLKEYQRYKVLSKHNSGQLHESRGLDSTYLELGTNPFKNNLLGVRFSSVVNHRMYKLHISTSSSLKRDDFLREIESATNWKIEPATLEELENLK